ncbi:MAG: methyl-accepting chemotaxis protein [Gemmatimonadetes bacterium]|nr:methyl-accepting chemotaxis protein [Gemmatimonadota bacterium]
MTKTSNVNVAPLIRLGVQAVALVFLIAAVGGLAGSIDTQQGSFAAELVLLVMAAALTRRFGFALPGQGFTSLIMGVVWVALFSRGWPFAVLVAGIGTATGDLLFRRLGGREVLLNMGHLATATGLVGVLYGWIGGELGAGAVTLLNLGPLSAAIVLLSLLTNTTFYLELASSRGFAWVDAWLTLRWEAVMTLVAAGLGLGWLAVATSDASVIEGLVAGGAMIAATMVMQYLLDKAIHADHLFLIQKLAGTVAADVSIARSFERLQEVTARLVPWEHMGFARYDEGRHEMELIADTGTTEPLRFDTRSGPTGRAVETGAPVVSGKHAVGDMILPAGETPGAEILIPLLHGGRLVGLWSVRHSNSAMYSEADGELLNKLAPHLGLVIALSAVLTPMANSSELAAKHVRDLESGCHALGASAEGASDSARRAEEEAEEAGTRLASIGQTINRLLEGIAEASTTGQDVGNATQEVASAASGLHESSSHAVDRLAHLSETIQASAAEVVQLREAANEVEGFSETIATIANQTNLLALNATIEAARAGVHGRGFAVVADEVRGLAEESARAARSIGRSAQRTRRVVDSSAKLMEEIADRLGELSRNSVMWGAELDKIVDSARSTSHLADRMRDLPRANMKIATQTREMLEQAQQLARHAAEDARAVKETLHEQRHSVRQLSDSAARLAQVATQLEEGASFIRGNGSGGTGPARPDPRPKNG